MDSNLLLDLIAQGENEQVDFKQELNLESSDEKAEFIKDLISLANSVPEHGYLIIGIDNAKGRIGIKSLEEEKIQQIAHTYIYPSIVIHCYIVPLDSVSIGVIEVKPTEKPHQVIRNIGRLLLNDVFIRHGSTTAKASPSEISRMRERETGLSREIAQLSRAAEKHLQLGNIDQTIASYTKAIELMPTPELMLSRGQMYKKYFAPESVTDYLEVEKGELALKDFSSALALVDSLELQKKIKLARLELFSICPLRDKSWDDDFSWAENNLDDKEYALVMFYAARKMDVMETYANEGWDSNQIIEYIDTAISLGFEDPRAYYLRSSAHSSNNNYGLALYDINIAIELARDNPRLLLDCLNLRISIFMSVRSYQQAFEDLLQAFKLSPADTNFRVVGDLHYLTREIYQRIGIQWKFGIRKKDVGIYDFILTLLILEDGSPEIVKLTDGSLKEYARGSHIEEEFPYLATVLQEIVGTDMWQAAKRGRSYTASISLKPDAPP